MNMFDLQYNQAMEEVEASSNIVLNPLIKPMFAQMSKSANMEKGAFHQTLLHIFQLIGELLQESNNVEIDLAEFGKFEGMRGKVMYMPINKNRPSGMGGK